MIKRLGIMMDLETLGMTGKAVCTQLSWVAVDLDDPENELRVVEEFLPIQPQQALGRTIDSSTLLWWMKQDDKARSKFQANAGEDMEELLAYVSSANNKLTAMLAQAESYEIWARGPQFDITIFESLLADCGQQPSYDYSTVRDLRTLMSLAGIGTKDVERRAGLVPHHALSDVRYQLDCLFESLRRLRARS